MSELKPCPFCGENQKIISHPIASGKKQYSVQCSCGARLYFMDRRYKAIEVWNRRVENAADNAPTIDAVPVVRCDYCARRYEENGEYFCSRTDMSCADDDFCSYGVRRVEDAAD